MRNWRLCVWSMSNWQTSAESWWALGEREREWIKQSWGEFIFEQFGSKNGPSHLSTSPDMSMELLKSETNCRYTTGRIIVLISRERWLKRELWCLSTKGPFPQIRPILSVIAKIAWQGHTIQQHKMSWMNHFSDKPHSKRKFKHLVTCVFSDSISVKKLSQKADYFTLIPHCVNQLNNETWSWNKVSVRM